MSTKETTGPKVWKKIMPTMLALHARWEKEKSPVNKYAKEISSWMKKNTQVQFGKMVARPFGFTFLAADGWFQIGVTKDIYKMRTTKGGKNDVSR